MPKVFRERPDLENSNFRGQNLAKADFRNAGLSGADFSRANLRQADFSGADLQRTKFHNADLRGSHFIKASGEAQPGTGLADFSEAKIQGANFTEATLNRANFSGAQAGLSQGWAFLVILCAGLFSLLSAFPAMLAGVFTAHFFLDSRRQPSALALTIIGLGAVLLTVALRTLLNYFWGPAAIAAHVFIGIGLILIIAVVIAPTVTIDDSKADIGGIVLLVIAALAPLTLFLFTSTFKDAEAWLAQRFPLLAEYITHIPGAAPTNGRWLSGWFGALIGAGFGGYFAHLAIAGDRRFD